MPKKIYLVHHTHYDIGFTDQPEEVVRQQLNYLDRALRICENEPGYRWTIESGRLLREWLESRPEYLRIRMLDMLRMGRMEVGALDMQILTETATFSDMVENVRRTADIGRYNGFKVETAILDDIGGLAGEFPSALNACGVRYFILGTGTCQTEIPWADLPYLFYLKTPAGGKILVWNIGCDRQEKSVDAVYPSPNYGVGANFLGYHAFREFLNELDLGIFIGPPGESRENPMPTRQLFSMLEDRLERNGYPYNELLLQYGGDNRPPAPKMFKVVEALNQTGQFPEIRLATPSEFFHEMEEKYADAIPVLSGLFTDPWNLRINSVPSVLKSARAAQRLHESLQLKGIHSAEITEDLLLTSDHTLGLNIWGWQTTAAESPYGIRDAAFDAGRISWRRKRLYAEQAWRRAQELEHRLAVLQEETEAVSVKNSAPHPVSGNTELYLASYAPRLLSLKDETGAEIPRQLIGTNRWMIQVPHVHGLGSKRLIPEFDTKFDQFFTAATVPVPATLSCGDFTLAFQNGKLMQITAADGKHLLDGTAGLGEVVLETVRDVPVTNEHYSLKECTDRFVQHMDDATAFQTADGELFTEITRQGKLANGSARTVLRIWKTEARIDISIRLDLPESPDKRCIYAAFPFAGTNAVNRFDQNAGIATLDKLLPGAMQDLFFCSRYVAQETENLTAILCCPDAPVVEFGGMNTARWFKSLPYAPKNNTIYALLANNICNTDAPAWSDIQDTFSFSLFLDKHSFNAATAQQCFESVTALNAELSFDSESAPIIGLPSTLRMHPAPDGFWLENLTDAEQPFNFTFNGKSYCGTIKPFAIHNS